MKLAFLVLTALTVLAQTVTVAPPTGLASDSRSVTIILRPRTVIATFTCTLTTLEPNEVTICTVALNQPARPGGYTMEIMTAPELRAVADAASVQQIKAVTVQAGSTSVTFAIRWVEPIAVGRISFYPLWAAWWVAGEPGTRAALSASLPCCIGLDTGPCDAWCNRNDDPRQRLAR